MQNKWKAVIGAILLAALTLNVNASTYPEDITGNILHYLKERQETDYSSVTDNGVLLSSTKFTKTYKTLNMGDLKSYWQQVEIGIKDSSVATPTGGIYNDQRDIVIVYAKEGVPSGTDWYCRVYLYRGEGGPMYAQHPSGGWVYTGWTAVNAQRQSVQLHLSHGKIGKVEAWGTTSQGYATYTKETGVDTWGFDLTGESLSWDEWCEAWSGSTLIDNETLSPGSWDYATLGDGGTGGLYNYTVKILRKPKQ